MKKITTYLVVMMLLPLAVMAQQARVDYHPVPPTTQPFTALKAVKPDLTQQQVPASEPQKMYYATQNDNSPKPVTNLRWECVPYTLTGSIYFTMPTQTIYGPNQHDLTGMLTYRVLVIGNMGITPVDTTGTAMPGEDVVVSIEVENSGDYILQVFVLDDAENESEIVRFPEHGKFRIGETTPEIGQFTKTELIDNKTINLEWSEPTPFLTGGWFDESQVSYQVKRSDGEIVADGISECSFTETIDIEEPTAVSYQVNLFSKGSNTYSSLSTIKFTYGAPLDLPWNSGTDFSAFGGGGWTFYSDYAEQSYNASWLISPPLNLKKGVYRITFDANKRDTVIPISVFLGKDYNTTNYIRLVDITDDRAGSYQTYEVFITIDEPMVGYVAFSGERYDYYIRNIAVAPFESVEAPGAVQNLAAEPVTLGALQANITMIAPSVNQINEPTTQALTKVELYRGDELINTFDTPAQGATLSYVDNNVTTGYATYKAIAYNEAGQSIPASATTFFGVDIPVCPESLDVNIIDNDVTFTWPEVTRGKNGEYVGNVRYFLMDPNLTTEVAADINGTSYTFHNVDLSGEQGWLYLYVGARNESGTSTQVVRNDYIVVGTPRELPYHETFPNKGNVVTLAEEGFLGAGSGTNWYTEKTNQDANGDNGLIKCAISTIQADNHDDLFKLHLPLMDFSATENPVLIFHVKLERQGLQPYFIDGYTGEWQPLGDVLKDSTWYCDGAWHKVEIPLPMAKGCSIGHIMFSNKSEGRNGGYIYLDDIKVFNLVNSMSVQIDAPTILDVDETGEVTVTVTNDGPATVDENGYSVDVYLNDELVEMQPVALARDESTTITFTITPAVTDEQFDIRAVVHYADDKRMEDNEAEASIKVNLKQYPNVIDLEGSATDGMVSLDWNEPVQTGQVNMEVTEDCEGLIHGDTGGLGGWYGTPPSTYTGIGKIGDWTVQNLPVANSYPSQFWPDNYQWYEDGEDEWKMYTYCSWQVFSRSDFPNEEGRYEAHSGDQYFGSRGVYTMGGYYLTNLHVLISPRLTGKEQKISFWARYAFNHTQAAVEYNDDYKLYVGWTDTESLDDLSNITFHYLDLFNTNLWQWEKKSYSLPEGANYFVLLDSHYDNNSRNGAPMMLDDITYTAVVDTTLTLLGYNVYRDGALLAELRSDGNGEGYNVYHNGVLKAENVLATNYVDVPEEDGVYTYQVTAVYAEGESAPSNKVRIVFANDLTGIGDITARGSVQSVRYVNPAGMVSDKPFDGVNIVVTTMTDGSTRTTKLVR